MGLPYSFLHLSVAWASSLSALRESISSVFFFPCLSNFSRDLLDVDGCDNTSLCCPGKDADAADCRSESVTCAPAIQYIDVLPIFKYLFIC